MKQEIKEKICLAPKGENIQCEYCEYITHCEEKAREIEAHVYSGSVDVYDTGREIIICGNPDEMLINGEKQDDCSDEHPHNCDEMGCTTVSHVIFRFQKGR
jgi:transcription elongation factor Elf1